MHSAAAYAERYAALGWPVIPIAPGSKAPAGGNGIEHATTDSQAIRRWFERWPDAGIGVRLDAAGLVAVDIDPRNGGDLELMADLPFTLTASTGGGGRHLIYRAAEGVAYPGHLRTGVDLKHRGYIVVEPSRHPSGNGYAWIDWAPLEDGEPEIADAPAELLTPPFNGAEPPPPEDRQAQHGDERIRKGGRNEFLSRQAFVLRKRGLSVPEIEAVLQIRNRERCEPPLPEAEVRAIAEGKATVEPDAATIDDFLAYMPTHQYVYVPAGDIWPGASVNGRVSPVKVGDKNVKPTTWLDIHRPIEQMVWHPGEPPLISGKLMHVAGWIDHPGAAVFNLYRPPRRPPGNASQAGPWLDHVRKVYPDDHAHIITWLAQRVQQPGVKVNHALVLGGLQGTGKDTLLEPMKAALGPWNVAEISPTHLLGRFNGWLRSTLIRMSEARDLGDVDRFALYDHSKTIIAAPPDVLRVDEKHLRETYAVNVAGVVITTNHASDGLYLPADDRRHFVAWSPLRREDFEPDYWAKLYDWFAAGGTGHVCAYLSGLDITGFDPKAPPQKTPAFWTIVAAGEAPETGELRDVIETMGSPAALTIADLVKQAHWSQLSALADDLQDRRNRRTLPHRLERAGYVPVRNPDADDGLFKVDGRRQAIYAQRKLPAAEQIRAARAKA